MQEFFSRLCDLALYQRNAKTQGARTRKDEKPFFRHLLKATESIRIGKFYGYRNDRPDVKHREKHKDGVYILRGDRVVWELVSVCS